MSVGHLIDAFQDSGASYADVLQDIAAAFPDREQGQLGNTFYHLERDGVLDRQSLNSDTLKLLVGGDKEYQGPKLDSLDVKHIGLLAECVNAAHELMDDRVTRTDEFGKTTELSPAVYRAVGFICESLDKCADETGNYREVIEVDGKEYSPVEYIKEVLLPQSDFLDSEKPRVAAVVDAFYEGYKTGEGFHMDGQLSNEDVDRMAASLGISPEKAEAFAERVDVQDALKLRAEMSREEDAKKDAAVKERVAEPVVKQVDSDKPAVDVPKPVTSDTPQRPERVETTSDNKSAVIEKVKAVIEMGLATHDFKESDLSDYNAQKTIILRSDKHPSVSMNVAYLQDVIDGRREPTAMMLGCDWDRAIVEKYISLYDMAIDRIQEGIDDGSIDADAVITAEETSGAPYAIREALDGKTSAECLSILENERDNLVEGLGKDKDAKVDNSQSDGADKSKEAHTETRAAQAAKSEPKPKSNKDIYNEARNKYNDKMARFGTRDISTAIARLNSDFASRYEGSDEKVGIGRIVCDIFGILQCNLIEAAIIHVIDLVASGIEKGELQAAKIKDQALEKSVKDYIAADKPDIKQQVLSGIDASTSKEAIVEKAFEVMRGNSVDPTDTEAVKPYAELLSAAGVSASDIDSHKKDVQREVRIARHEENPEKEKDYVERGKLVDAVKKEFVKIPIPDVDKKEEPSSRVEKKDEDKEKDKSTSDEKDKTDKDEKGSADDSHAVDKSEETESRDVEASSEQESEQKEDAATTQDETDGDAAVVAKEDGNSQSTTITDDKGLEKESDSTTEGTETEQAVAQPEEDTGTVEPDVVSEEQEKVDESVSHSDSDQAPEKDMVQVYAEGAREAEGYATINDALFVSVEELSPDEIAERIVDAIEKDFSHQCPRDNIQLITDRGDYAIDHTATPELKEKIEEAIDKAQNLYADRVDAQSDVDVTSQQEDTADISEDAVQDVESELLDEMQEGVDAIDTTDESVRDGADSSETDDTTRDNYSQATLDTTPDEADTGEAASEDYMSNEDIAEDAVDMFF